MSVALLEKCFYENTLPSSSGTLFTVGTGKIDTVGTGKIDTVTCIHVCNNSGATRTFTVSMNGVMFIPDTTLLDKQTYTWEGRRPVAASQTVTGSASGSGVTAHISGAERTV